MACSSTKLCKWYFKMYEAAGLAHICFSSGYYFFVIWNSKIIDWCSVLKSILHLKRIVPEFSAPIEFLRTSKPKFPDYIFWLPGMILMHGWCLLIGVFYLKTILVVILC